MIKVHLYCICLVPKDSVFFLSKAMYDKKQSWVYILDNMWLTIGIIEKQIR